VYGVSAGGANHVKRTNIVLDQSLIRRAKSLTGLKTIREVVDYARRELIRRREQRRILELEGNVDRAGDLAALRRGRDPGRTRSR